MNYEKFLRDEFTQHLDHITPNQQVLWGSMSPQHIVEHFGLIFMLSNGRMTVAPNAEPDRLAYRKMRFFEKDVPFPRSFRAPFLPETAMPLKFESIEVAKQKTVKELQRFFEYFVENPKAQAMHPVLGPLNATEWTEFHTRHIRHHLTQLGFEF